MIYFWCMVLCILGFVLGLLVANLFKKPLGVLKIDKHDPEKDTYRFDIYDFDALESKKKIVLKVDTNADLSH